MISVLFKSAIKSFDSLLNLLIFCVWLKSWRKDSLRWCFSNFPINFLTLFSRIVFCLLDCRKRHVTLAILRSTVLLHPELFESLVGSKTILRLGFVDLADHMRFLLNVLDLLEGTGIDWKSLDSRSIQIFSSLLLLFASFDIQSSSNHCEAPSNFFFLHSSMMLLYWIAPSNPRRTVRSCRNSRINSIISWLSLNCSEVQELIGRVWIQAILTSVLSSASFCQSWYPIFKWPLQSTIHKHSGARPSLPPYYDQRPCCFVLSRGWQLKTLSKQLHSGACHLSFDSGDSEPNFLTNGVGGRESKEWDSSRHVSSSPYRLETKWPPRTSGETTKGDVASHHQAPAFYVPLKLCFKNELLLPALFDDVTVVDRSVAFSSDWLIMS